MCHQTDNQVFLLWDLMSGGDAGKEPNEKNFKIKNIKNQHENISSK